MSESKGVTFKWMVQGGPIFHEPIMIWPGNLAVNSISTKFHSVEDAERFRNSFDAQLKDGNEKDKWVLCQQSMMPLTDRFLAPNAEDLSKILAVFEGAIDPESVRKKWNEERPDQYFFGDFIGFTSKGLSFVCFDWSDTGLHEIPWDFLRFM